MKYRIANTLQNSADALAQMSTPLAEQIHRASEVLVEALLRGARIFTWGTGLNSSPAQACAHLLHTTQQRERPPFPAICLSSDVSLMSLDSTEIVLKNQLAALAQPGDILIAFCQGDGPPTARALQSAHQRDLTVIAFCCPQDEEILNVLNSTDCAVMPFTDNAIIAIHTQMLALVVLCDTVEQQLFGGSQ